MICLKNIVKTYNKGKSNAYEALHGISMEIQDGEMTAVIGTSGAGKSTLLHILACIDGYDSGEYTIDGEEVGKISEKQMAQVRNEKIGMVMQDFALVDGFTALDNVLIPLDFAGGKQRLRKKERREKALKMLDMVGMKEFAGKPVNNLSGGQKQRVAIARALATNPKVLLCDEATSALDPKTTKQILDLLKKINQEMGVTVIVITHQMSVIEAICDNVAIIDHSHIAESGPVSEVFSNPKTEIGRRLILGDGNANAIQPVNFGDSKNPKIRIIFDGQKAHRPIISDIVLSCNAPVNILFANTKEVEGKAVGQMVVELPDSVEEAERITHYLKTNDIRFEEVK